MTNPDTVSGIEKKSHILVVDDTDVNQKIAQLILQKADYRVDIAENGQQAVEAHQQNRYDLILMDIQMPIMDGHEATRKIRELELKAQSSKLKGRGSGELSASSFQLSARAQTGRMQNEIGKNSDPNSDFRIPTSDFKEVPIVAMTGSAGPGSFDETLYPGMNDCFGKPLQRDRLLSVVQKWINADSKTHTIENPADEIPAIDKKHEKNQYPLDLDRAIEEFMGQKEILLGVLQKFLTSTGSQLDNIRHAVKEADYGVLGSKAHAIKGAAANLTADKLADLAADLEQAADKRQPDLSTELADKLEQEFYSLKKYIRQIPTANLSPADPTTGSPAAEPNGIFTG